MSKTAIAILNYNGQAFLQKFLPTLINFSNDTPIYIGDNASSDNSVQFIKEYFSEITLIELDDNYGYSKGYNLLLEQIEADFVAIVNSDIEVTPNWLKPLIQQLALNSDLAAIQPKIKSYHNKAYFEYAGAAGGFIDKYGYPFCRGRIVNTIEKDEGQYNDSIPIKWAAGACFLVRKTAFDLVGSFDDDFFAHMEEIDLCWRLSSHDFKIAYCAESTVYHVGGGTLNYDSPFKTYLNYRNGLYLLLKNIPKENLRSIIVIRILLDWMSVIYFLLKGKVKLCSAVLKAHIDVLKTHKRFLAKRTSEGKDTDYTQHYSVVWRYFFKRRRTYTTLSLKKNRSFSSIRDT